MLQQNLIDFLKDSLIYWLSPFSPLLIPEIIENDFSAAALSTGISSVTGNQFQWEIHYLLDIMNHLPKDVTVHSQGKIKEYAK
jgi:hypothetical protein